MKLMSETVIYHTQHENPCSVCNGHISSGQIRVAFRQQTNLGDVECEAEIPIGICDSCGLRNWDKRTEAIIEESVRREYVKLLSMRRRQPSVPDPSQIKAQFFLGYHYPLGGFAKLAQRLATDGEQDHGSYGGVLTKIDPVMHGLIAQLPKPGDVWPEADRKGWLQLLEGSFKLIYKS